MEYFAPILICFVGLAVGGVTVWAFLRNKGRDAFDRARAEVEPERAMLNERLRGYEQQLQEFKGTLAAQNTELTGLRNDLRAEAEKRSAAEQKNARIPELETELRERKSQIDQLQNANSALLAKISETETKLQEERKATEEKLSLISEAQLKLSDAFKALSAEALRTNNQSFLDLAKTTLEKFQESAKGDLDKKQQAITELVKPVRDSLEKFDFKIQELEKARTGAYEGLNQQVRSLLETQIQLRSETANLVKALRAPIVRGRWGEIQLKRVVEMAGMVDHCDFYEQQSVSTEDGRLRPDLLVRLPANKNIIIDAKAPMEAYLSAIEATDDATRKAKLVDHARQIRAHMTALGRKSYWDQFQPAPEFVVLFLPGETFFSAALEQDPSLIEMGVEQRVILATPTTLIAVLRAVAYGWRQENLAQNAQAISDLGRELYKRMSDLAGHWSKVGKSLGSAVENYNRAVGSLETRVLSTARKFQELEAAPAGVEIEEMSPIDQTPRSLQAPEMSVSPDSVDATAKLNP